MRNFTEKVKPPRSIFLKWPFGHVLGEPFNVAQQRAVLVHAFRCLYESRLPGEIVDIPFRWRKETYDQYNDLSAIRI
ncbi:MAG TPA: hypothetical protein ENH50_10915 [Nitrospirae bacterium]|nr:hypothetical protein [Nitrospirota bacterium]